MGSSSTFERHAASKRLSPPPPQLSFDGFGMGELMTLQEHVDLMPLLTLRMTSKAIRTSLDDAAPPAVRLVHWILDKKLVDLGAPYNRDLPGYDACNGSDAWRHAHRTMGAPPFRAQSPGARTLHMKNACTCTLLDANWLLEGAAFEMSENGVHVKRFRDRWRDGLLKELRSRMHRVVWGYDSGRWVVGGHLSEEQSIELLKDIFERSTLTDNHAYARGEARDDGDYLTPFVFAAVGNKLKVLKFLAARKDVDVHWRSSEGDNAYTLVPKDIESSLEYYEEREWCFPSDGIFDGVRPGETYALYVARRREEMQTEYEPMLAYLRDELGRSTQSWNDGNDSVSEPSDYDYDEEDEEEDESESEEEGTSAPATLSAADAAFKAAWESDDDEW